MEKAFKAATDIIDPLVKTYNLIDVLNDIPIATEFFHLLQQILKDILSLFSMRMMIKTSMQLRLLTIYLLQRKGGLMNQEGKIYKNKIYAVMLAKELESFGFLLDDIRFIEILKPYTHVWVQPKELRLASKR